MVVFMVLHQAEEGLLYTQRERHQTCGYLIPNRQKNVEFVLIARSRGVQSFTFISEPPFVRTEIRKERVRGATEELRKNILVQD